MFLHLLLGLPVQHIAEILPRACLRFVQHRVFHGEGNAREKALRVLAARLHAVLLRNRPCLYGSCVLKDRRRFRLLRDNLCCGQRLRRRLHLRLRLHLCLHLRLREALRLTRHELLRRFHLGRRDGFLRGCCKVLHLLAGQAQIRAVLGEHVHELLVLRRLLFLRRILRKQGIQRPRHKGRLLRRRHLRRRCRRRFCLRRFGLHTVGLGCLRLRVSRHGHQHRVQRRSRVFRLRLCLRGLSVSGSFRFRRLILFAILRKPVRRFRRLFIDRRFAFPRVRGFRFLRRRLFRLLCVRSFRLFRLFRVRRFLLSRLLHVRPRVFLRILRAVQRAAEIILVRFRALRRRLRLYSGTEARARTFRRRGRLRHEIFCFHLFTSFFLKRNWSASLEFPRYTMSEGVRRSLSASPFALFHVQRTFRPTASPPFSVSLNMFLDFQEIFRWEDLHLFIYRKKFYFS